MPVPRRASSVAVLVLLLTASFVALVPTGVADPASPSVTLTADKTFAKIGDTITFTATVATGTGGQCTALGSFTDTITDVVLDAASGDKIGHPVTELAFTGSGTTWTLALDVRDALTGSGTDNAPVTFQATATARCKSGANNDPVVTNTATGEGTRSLNIDNKRPEGTAAFAFITSGTNAGQYGITLTPGAGATSARANLAGIGGSASEPLALVTAQQPFPIGTTAPSPSKVSVTYSDASGNAQAATLEAPVRLESFQVFALKEDVLRVQFDLPTGAVAASNDYAVVARPASASSWTLITPGPNMVRVSGTPTGIVAYDVKGLASGVSHELRAFAVSNGNHGVPTAIQTATPAAAPNSVSFSVAPFATGSSAIGIVEGTWNAETATPRGLTTLRISLRDVTGTLFWQNNTGNTFAAGTVASNPAPLVNVPTNAGLTEGTWSSNNFTTGASNHLLTLPEGQYTLVVEFLKNGVVDAVQVRPFLLDRTPLDRVSASVGTPATNTFVPALPVAAPFATIQQELTRPLFYMTVKDPKPATGSAFDRVEFTLHRMTSATATTPAAHALTGAPVVLQCRIAAAGTGCTTLSSGFDSGNALHANFSLTVPPVALGNYKWEVKAYDAASNVVNLLSTPMSAQFTVGPRLTLVNEPIDVNGVTAYDRPSVDSAGRVSLDVFTSFTALSSFNPQTSCPERSADTSYPVQRPCRVTGLEIWARNSSATTGTAANGKLVANLPIPTRGPSPFLWAGAGDPFLYYEHSPANPIQTDGFHPWHLDVKAVATVQTSSGAAPVTTDSGWIRALPPGATSSLSFNLPKDNTTVFLEHVFTFPNAAQTKVGKMIFNVSYDQPSLPAAPALHYTVWQNGTADTYLDIQTGSLVTGALEKTVSAINKAPFYYYNWTNGPVSLPRGEYVMNVSLKLPDGTVLITGSRFFGIENTTEHPIVVGFDRDPAADPAEGFVHRTFDVNVSVDHGFLNLTGAHNFVPRLVAQNTDPGSAGTRTISAGTDGFTFDLRQLVRLDESHSRAWLRVTLPDNATDGSRYDLLMNVSTDSYNATNLGRAAGTSLLTIVVDTVWPASGVYRDETNSTGDFRNAAPKIVGFAQDGGSGVQVVEVRIFNADTNQTFTWDALSGNGIWRIGHYESWLSSVPRQDPKTGAWFRDVVVTDTADPTLKTWTITTGPRSGYATSTLTGAPTATLGALALDRNASYLIEVRSKDILNEMSPRTTHDVTLDRLSPNVTSPLVQLTQGATVGPTGYVGWHGSAKLKAQVQDNHCVKVAALWSKLPSGRVTGPFNMTWDATAGANPGQLCGPAATGASDLEWWTIDLAKHPLATDEVGVVELTLMVEDEAGHRFNDSRTVNLTVNDTAPAEVRDVFLEPPVVPQGAGSRIIASVWDNLAVLNVTAILYQRGGDGTTTELARGNMTPVSGQTDANGIGNWSISSADVGLSGLALGNYQWLLRPVDTVTTVDCGDQDCLAPRNTIQCSPDCTGRTEIFQVLEDVGVIIQQDAPASGSSFVNATPVLRWKVFGKAVTANDVTVLAGPSAAALSVVDAANVTVTSLPLIGTQAPGVSVEYLPTVEGDTFAVRLRAASGGATNETPIVSYEVDRTPPNATVEVTGDVPLHGKRWATDNTRVAITANDTHPGPITYFVNGVGPTMYTGALTPQGVLGDWKLDYVAMDAAGNRQTGTLTLSLDRKGPVVTPTKNGDEVLVTVEDEGVGLNESTVLIHYAYGDAAFTTQAMEKQAGNLYRIQLTGNASASGLKYYFEARDQLGNAGGSNATAAAPIVIRPESPVDDLPPTLKVTSPTANQTVRSSVELTWLAQDPENKALTITIALREPSGAGTVLQTAGPNNGTWTVDLSSKAEGTYALVVTASDGLRTAQETVLFLIKRTQLIEVPTPPPSVVEANKAVSVSIKVNADKAISTATYTLLRDNETVSSGAMRGTAGSYSASLLPTEPGAYKVLVAITYADGTSEPAQQVSSFQVAGTTPTPGPGTGGALPASLITLVVLALATIALAAYAAMRWKP